MRKLKKDKSSRRIVFIDGNARISADEHFVGACDPEPCNNNGERSNAAMKMDEMGTRGGQRTLIPWIWHAELQKTTDV